MKNKEFKVGDYVRVKGHKQVMYIPRLTVDKRGAYCSWSDTKNKLHKDIYPFSQLELIIPDHT